MEKARTYTVTEARKHFAEVFNEVAYGGKPAVIRKRGVHARAVAIVPYDILELLTRVEAVVDIHHAELALDSYRKEGGISLSAFKKQLVESDDD
jgi:prevent-host-death family protein